MKEKKKAIGRRDFIEKSAVALGGILISGALTESCSKDKDNTGDTPMPAENSNRFESGVASFDPTDSQVIIWTRISPAKNEPKIGLDYKIATDIGMVDIVKSGAIEALAEDDYTISLDIKNLASNKRYYYQFGIPGTQLYSLVGETKTLPKGMEANDIKLAICSCSNYPSGLFNVYGAMAKSEADVVLHLGDYIYEYGQGEYGTNATTGTLGRAHLPANEILSLDDYRTRYKQYKSDPQLQLLHQKKPFICVWDDHELANDAYKDGAENHTRGKEGDFNGRKAYSIQAYHEYIGIRTADKTKIYRSFTFGNILDLHMLDTRVIGRDKQLNYADYVSLSGRLDVDAFRTNWMDSGRSMLGVDQRSWLANALDSGKGGWQVLGQQILMAKMNVPAEIPPVLAEIMNAGGNISPEKIDRLKKLVIELITIKIKMANNDPGITTEQRQRVSTTLPYNLDAWDGYPAEREHLYEMAKGKKLISLAGDTHNGWFSKLVSSDKTAVGNELATSSVTSPGFEAYLGADAGFLSSLEKALATLVDDLEYANVSQRGFVLATFSAEKVVSQWYYVSTIATPTTDSILGHTETIQRV
ncbi:MAG: alkaline phosphatase [Sphingobacterium sp.]|jgi:alkaline phosphatase D|nr:alkaline phosphatase [Sphingobacterium sp.]